MSIETRRFQVTLVVELETSTLPQDAASTVAESVELRLNDGTSIIGLSDVYNVDATELD